MKTYRLAVIPGDGIGPEVLPESIQTLTSLASIHGGIQFDLQQFDWGTDQYLREGALMPPNGLTTLEQGGFDAILLGPVGDPRVPDHITLWGLVLPLRQMFDQYINLRPVRLLPGVRSPLAEKQPAEMQRFLLHTCILEQLTGSLCDAITEEPGGQTRLAAALRANLFVNALDDTQTWYRYHALFAETLRTRLRMLEPNLVPELYRRASRCMNSNSEEKRHVSMPFSQEISRTRRLCWSD